MTRLIIVGAVMCSTFAWSADLPSGPGKDAVMKYCTTCHSQEQATSLREGERQWGATIDKMTGMGAKIPDNAYESILGYLTKNFGPDSPLPIKVNTDSAVELEALLLLGRAPAKAIIEYRTTHGDFKTMDDLKNVPGLDFKKIEAKKNLIVF